jgi:predicted kinase
MQEVIILRGLPGSGKSTWAERFIAGHPHYCRVNKDSLRAMFHGGEYSPANEALIVRARDALICQSLLLGWSVILDDTNLQEYHLQAVRTLAASFGVGVQVVTFDVAIEECIRRDAGRPKPVGEVVIRQLAETWRR